MNEQTQSGFSTCLAEWPVTRVRHLIEAATPRDVGRALDAERLGEPELAALLSPVAVPRIEELARRAATQTRQRFGHAMQFYVPLYVSNYCVNRCTYCGFNRTNQIPRRRLTVDEAVEEADYLAREGFRHILLVSGEDRTGTPVEYFTALVPRLRSRFASISMEIYSLTTDEYAALVAAGVDSLTLYQETYDPGEYRRHHPAGPKRDFTWRLNTMDRAATAGVTFLGVGALLGLADWRVDSFYVGLHARYLQRRYWRQHVSVSFPRLRRAAGAAAPASPVSDADLTQILCTQRLFLPDAGLVLSTREPAALRDALVPLGITRISAGSRTTPGGYCSETDAGGQFEVQDHRTLTEVKAAVCRLGFDPVCKDWDDSYHP